MKQSRVMKGKVFERRTAQKLRRLDPKARRCLQYQRQHGAPDIEAGPLWVECKAGRAPVAAVYRATAQAAKARLGTIPVVVHKASPRGATLVTLDLDHFLTLAACSPLMKSQSFKPAQVVVKPRKKTQLQKLQDLLLLASRKATLTALRSWTIGQRLEAEDWAAKSVLAASDNPVEVPPIPPHVAQLPEDR